jgi:hypothetical protein
VDLPAAAKQNALMASGSMTMATVVDAAAESPAPVKKRK